MKENTAVNLEPETNEVEEKTLSMLSQGVIAVSNPVNIFEYAVDKVITGLMTVGCYYAVNAAVNRVKEARALKLQSKK